MSERDKIVGIFPIRLRGCLERISFDGLEEIRVRNGIPIELIYSNRICSMGPKTTIVRADLEEMLNYMTGYSYYSMTEELKKGYLTIQGGHRIGLTGRINCKDTSVEEGVVVTGLVDIGGLNIRIAQERKGCANNIVPYLRRDSLIYNTLLFSAPGIGKTTYLRDLIRELASGNYSSLGLKICVIDERSEIGACYLGKPQTDLGARTDILDACPKEVGMEMVLRSMSPQVIAVDELGKASEFQILQKMRRSGVKILGTMHGGSLEELIHIYGEPLLSCFERFVELKRLPDGNRTYEIYEVDSGKNNWDSDDWNRYHGNYKRLDIST